MIYRHLPHDSPGVPRPYHHLAPVPPQRETMEDTGTIIDDLVCGFTYMGIFDGHGGSPVAEYLSERLHETFRSVIAQAEKSGALSSSECEITGVTALDREGICCPINLEAPLAAAFAKVDGDVIKWLQKTKPAAVAKEAGSTATVVLARPDKVVVANVGDSRCVLSRGGQAIDLSIEHRLYGRGPSVASEIRRVESVGGWVDDGRLCGILGVARSFGDWEWKGPGLEYLRYAAVEWGCWDEATAKSMKFSSDPVISTPDVTEVKLGPTDEFLLVASDGLWDVFSSQQATAEARKLLKQGAEPQSVADMLIASALRRKTEDNVVVGVIDFKGKEGWASATPEKKKLFGIF